MSVMSKIFNSPSNHIKTIYEELLILVKYGNFTRADVRNMTVLERKYYLEKLAEYQKPKT